MPALLGWLVSICGTLVGRVLIGLGITYLSYTGIDAGINAAKAEFFSNATGLGGSVTGLMGILKIDVCVSMLCSALIGRLTFQGMTSGVMKHMVIK
jgi:hypothetical protein